LYINLILNRLQCFDVSRDGISIEILEEVRISEDNDASLKEELYHFLSISFWKKCVRINMWSQTWRKFKNWNF